MPAYEADLERFKGYDAQVLGISVDSVPCNTAWAKSLGGLSYDLLGDFHPKGEVARAYGAKTTPDVFVLDADSRLRYRGAPDSDYADPDQRAAWVRDALDAVLAGQEPGQAETKPVGCSIKWKP